MAMDLKLVSEGLERKLASEQEAVIEIAKVVQRHQSEIYQAMYSSFQAFLKSARESSSSSLERGAREQEDRTLLEQTIQLCNDVMSSAILKLSFGELLEKFSDGSERVSATRERKTREEARQLPSKRKKQKEKESSSPLEVFNRSLQEKRGFESLIEATQKEFEIFFRTMKAERLGEQLNELWELIYPSKSTLALVLESARFFKINPDNFPDTDDGRETNNNKKEELVSKLSADISELILSIQKALTKVLFITIETDPRYTRRDILTIEKVPGFFIQFLQDIIQDIIKDPQNRGLLRSMVGTISRISKSVCESSQAMVDIPQENSLATRNEADNSRVYFIKAFRRDNHIPMQEGVFFLKTGTFVLTSLMASSIKSPVAIEDGLDDEEWVMVDGNSDIPIPRSTQALYDINSILALLRQGPFVKLTIGLATNAAISQFFTVYPKVHGKVKPYLLLGDIVGIVAAICDGRRAVLYPQREPKRIFRVIEATSEGLQVFVFILGGVIQGFLFYHPNDAYISNQDFYTKFVSGPLVLASAYTAFYAIPDAWDRCSKKNQKGFCLKMGLHALASVLLFGSITQNSMLNFGIKLTNNSYFWYDLFIPVAIAGVATALRMGTRYGESVRSFFSYLSLTNFAYTLYNQVVADKDEADFAVISDYIRCIIYPIVGSGAAIFTVMKARRFLLEFVDRGELITRRVRSDEEEQDVSLNGSPFPMILVGRGKKATGLESDPDTPFSPLLSPTLLDASEEQAEQGKPEEKGRPILFDWQREQDTRGSLAASEVAPSPNNQKKRCCIVL